jgi:hypothetical protein
MSQNDFWTGYDQGYSDGQYQPNYSTKGSKAVGAFIGKLVVLMIIWAVQLAWLIIKGLFKGILYILRALADVLMSRYDHNKPR